MKFRIGSYLMMLAVVTMLFSACGGGDGGGGGGSTPITVTTMRIPVLVNTSTTVVASFANYTSTVPFGSTVNFTVSSPPATFSNVSSITTRSIKTQAGGLAWVTVRSPLPGKFTVSASSGSLAGSTIVAFINQPYNVQVLAGLNKPITNLGGLSFNVLNDLPAPTFLNFSSSVAGANVTVQTTPLPPAAGVTSTSVTLTAVPGVNVAAGALFRLNYRVDTGVPIFTLPLSDLSAYLYDALFTPVTPDVSFTVTYFDSVGTKLYP